MPRRVKFGKNFITNWRFKIRGPGRVEFGDNVNMWGFKEWNTFTTLSSNSEIKIGDGCRLNGAELISEESIEIGTSCILGSCLLVDTDFHSLSSDRLTNPDAEVASGPIKLKDNVWIGGRAAVLKGVEIGERAVVGFGSLVSKDVPSGVVVAGNPAEVIKKID